MPTMEKDHAPNWCSNKAHRPMTKIVELDILNTTALNPAAQNTNHIKLRTVLTLI